MRKLLATLIVLSFIASIADARQETRPKGNGLF